MMTYHAVLSAMMHLDVKDEEAVASCIESIWNSVPPDESTELINQVLRRFNLYSEAVAD